MICFLYIRYSYSYRYVIQYIVSMTFDHPSSHSLNILDSIRYEEADIQVRNKCIILFNSYAAFFSSRVSVTTCYTMSSRHIKADEEKKNAKIFIKLNKYDVCACERAMHILYEHEQYINWMSFVIWMVTTMVSVSIVAMYMTFLCVSRLPFFSLYLLFILCRFFFCYSCKSTRCLCG